MTVQENIEKRRAYRALEPVEITKEIVEDLARNAQLAASCFNYQPWNFVFVYKKEKLLELHDALSKNNAWAKKASMIIAVFSKRDLDCTPKDRDYFLFDTGMATATMILRGTEMGLVMHPIAGYSQTKTKEILGIPDEMTVITLVIVGKKSNDLSLLNEGQIKSEKNRPPRKPLEEFVHHNHYSK